MTANETFKVKTADEREAEFNAYYKNLDDEFKAQAYELAKHIEAFMDNNPDSTYWIVLLNADLWNECTRTHLEKLYRDAGFNISTEYSMKLSVVVVGISRK